MPVHPEMEHIGDVPWEWLQDEAPTYFPRRPSLTDSRGQDIDHVRFRYVQQEPFWQEMKETYGSETTWNILNAGSREMLVDGRYQDLLKRAIVARFNEHLASHFDHHLNLRESMPFPIFSKERALRYSDHYMSDIAQEMSPHPLMASHSIRTALAASGALFSTYYGAATPKRIRQQTKEGSSYLRYAPDENPLYKAMAYDLVDHYGLPFDAHVLLTGKGKQAISLVYDALMLDYFPLPASDWVSDARGVAVVGDMYAEANAQIQLWRETPRFSIIDEVDFDELTIRLDHQLGDKFGAFKMQLFFVDPLENSPHARTHDIGRFLERVSQWSKKTDTMAVVVSDLTLMAGEFDMTGAIARIIPESKTVFITIESLLKYFGMGSDLSYMGAITMHAPYAGEGIWHFLKERYTKYALSPSIADLASFPPITSEYMHYRTNRIHRNRKMLTQLLNQEFSEIQMTFHEEKAHFNGGLIWVDLRYPENVDYVVSTLDAAMDSYWRFGAVMDRDGFGYQQTTLSRVGRYLRISVGCEDMFLMFCQALHLKKVLADIIS